MQVLIFILQVPDGPLEGSNIFFIFIINTIGSGESARVNLQISMLLRIEIFIIMVIHMGVHM
jgi:hypothetical protein